MNAYGSLAPFYDSFMPEEDYHLWAESCDGLFRPRGIRTVLDLACGTGRLSWLLAERGYEVIGVDLSCDMLAVAMERQASAPVTVPLFLNQPLQALDLYGTVQAAICSMDGFNYLAPHELREALRRIHLFLEPGGLLFFDLNTPEKFNMMDGEVYVEESDNAFCVWRAECEEERCFYGMDLFIREGAHWSRRQEEHIEYIYPSEQLCAMAEAAGFSSPRVFGGLPLRSPEPEEERLFFLCEAVK